MQFMNHLKDVVDEQEREVGMSSAKASKIILISNQNFAHLRIFIYRSGPVKANQW